MSNANFEATGPHRHFGTRARPEHNAIPQISCLILSTNSRIRHLLAILGMNIMVAGAAIGSSLEYSQHIARQWRI
jgi:hypothetical protein